METQQERIARVLAEPIEIEPYNPDWPERFDAEARHLRAVLPGDWLGRIEHFGSTAVPGLAAKPVVDMLIEVRDVQVVRREAPGLLRPPVYDFFWRPTVGDDTPPFYPWFIKRNAAGRRSHHLHFVQPDFDGHWARLEFRDRLRDSLDLVEAYGRLKTKLAERYRNDRIAYTQGKGDFIRSVMERSEG